MSQLPPWECLRPPGVYQLCRRAQEPLSERRDGSPKPPTNGGNLGESGRVLTTQGLTIQEYWKGGARHRCKALGLS